MAAAKASDEVTGEIADAAYNPHTGLGPGLIYSDCHFLNVKHTLNQYLKLVTVTILA